MNKEDKKKLMDEYKMMQEKEFESSLPMERKLFYELSLIHISEPTRPY